MYYSQLLFLRFEIVILFIYKDVYSKVEDSEVADIRVFLVLYLIEIICLKGLHWSNIFSVGHY